jgi:hypothetical protein
MNGVIVGLSLIHPAVKYVHAVLGKRWKREKEVKKKKYSVRNSSRK